MSSFKCWMGARVSSLIQEDGRTVGVRGIRHGNERFEVRADVVVAADGRYSNIVKMAGFTPEYEHHDFDVIWFTIPQPPGWSSTLYISLGTHARGLMLPKYPHHIQVGLVMPPGQWKQWRKDGVAAVADRIRRFDPICAEFAGSLQDFTPFFPLEGLIRFVDDWARDGLLLIGDAAHTMSPVGAIGVNVAIASAAVAAQVIYPRLGRGPIPRRDLQEVQRLREGDVRTLHRMQLQAQRVLLGGGTPVSKWLMPKLLPLVLRSPLMPRVQRRIFLGPALPPLDPAFSFREPVAAVA